MTAAAKHRTSPNILRAGRLLVRAGAPALGPHEIAIDAAGRIAAVMPIDATELTVDEARLLAMPALADAHDHGRGLRTLAIGAADQPLETWMHDLARQPPVDPYLNAATALARLAQSGICAVNHCHNTQSSETLLAEAEAVSRAARDVGIAVGFGWPFFDRHPFVHGDPAPFAALLPPEWRAGVIDADRGLRSCEANLALMGEAASFEHALFRLQYHPVAPQWTKPETLARIARASAADGRRVHVHLLETEPQREWADAHHPGGLLPWLDTLGLLSPRLTVAHAVWLSDIDCALLAARGVTVSINISSNLRLRSGMARVPALLAAGVAIGIGLDGMSLDDDEDMLRELRLAHHAFARPALGGSGLDTTTALDAIWRCGRRSILGDDGGGAIVPGAPADLLCVDHAALSWDCLADDLDPATLLLGRGQKKHIVRMIVDGRTVVEQGRCTGVDLSALEAKLVAQARAARADIPPDDQRIAAFRTATRLYYEQGHHCLTRPLCQTGPQQ